MFAILSQLSKISHVLQFLHLSNTTRFLRFNDIFTDLTRCCTYDVLHRWVGRRHIHYLWNINMAAWLHHGNNLPQELNCLTSLGRSTSHIGNNTKLSSLPIDRQLKFNITAWSKLGNKATENGNKSIKYRGSYFTAVKASSWDLANTLTNDISIKTPWHGNIFRVTAPLWRESTGQNVKKRVALMFCLMYALTNGWINSGVGGDMTCHDAHATSL